MRSVFGSVMWMGRATVFLVGLSVVLAAVFTASSMAFAANGTPFILGKKNVAKAVSTLAKQGPGPALKLIVRPGQPPMTVSSKVRVPNLNADKVDGKDANQLSRVAFSGGISPLPSGVNGTVATTKVNAPAPGFLVIVASSDVRNYSQNSIVDCIIEVNNAVNAPSVRRIELNGAASVNRDEDCSTNTVVPAPAGTHTVDLEARNVTQPSTKFGETALSAMYVPFDGQGNAP